MADDLNLNSDDPITISAIIWFMEKILDHIQTNIEIGETGKDWVWQYESNDERLKEIIGRSKEDQVLLSKVLTKIHKAQSERVLNIRQVLQEMANG